MSSKGRLSSDSTEAEPAFKRSKSDADEDEDPIVVVSPRKSFNKRKSGAAVASAGKDEVMEEADSNNDGKEEIVVTTEEVTVVEIVEQVPSTEEKVADSLAVPETVTEEVTVVEEVVTTTVTEVTVEAVEKPADGEASLPAAVTGDNLGLPSTEQLNGEEKDQLKLKGEIESQGIEAVAEDPILAAVKSTSDQPSAERVGVST